MNRAFVILGAGKPYRGEQHVALKQAVGGSRVLDWLLQAAETPQESVHFVGGYQIDSVREHYPQLNYWLNSEWRDTRAAYSLLLADLPTNTECIVSYSDILFRQGVVERLCNAEGDLVVTVDSRWQKRYAGRKADELAGREKTCMSNGRVVRAGADIDSAFASAEFVGCVRFGAKVMEFLSREKKALVAKCKTSSLSDLVELLRLKGFSVAALDLCGDWAELNEPQDIAHFILGTKAQTLFRLRGMVAAARILEQVSFTVQEWDDDPAACKQTVISRLGQGKVVVRSSAVQEDGFADSHAGAFKSVLNVNSAEGELLDLAIREVITSYPDSNAANQVLIQPMLEDVLASGVVFTRSLTTGAPYYVINYDDSSGRTDTITGGDSRDDKTFIVHRSNSQEPAGMPACLRGLLPAICEVERLLNYDTLDIEFVITRDGVVNILQVRPMTVRKPDWGNDDSEIQLLLLQCQARFRELQLPNPFTVGSSTVFGIMPDWNPAEIIGIKPGRLAHSIYLFLILNDTWSTQRAQYGYRDVRGQPLMVSFAGHPYIDVRASFNSFMPAAIDDELAGRLVDFYLRWLATHPELHDKVEFDVVPTCYDLDFARWQDRLSAAGFTVAEIAQLENALQLLTADALTRVNADFAVVEESGARFERIAAMPMAPLDKAFLLLADARSHGALAFAHLARSAFVAMSLLRSGVSKGIITKGEMGQFLATIRTVSHELVADASACAEGLLSQQAFVDKYGHLRPGTYDVTSQSYKDDPGFYLAPIVALSTTQEAEESAVDTQAARAVCEKLAAALVGTGLHISAKALHDFLTRAIEGREYGKFVFTRNLSMALDLLANWAGEHGITRQQLALLSLEEVRALHDGQMPRTDMTAAILDVLKNAQNYHEKMTKIELPPLLTRTEDFLFFQYPSTSANFVGSENVIAQAVVIEGDPRGMQLEGAIALIANADPGYDWLFGRKIAGLITAYGGANSHMAIRAAEFGLPAAIGVGEVLYRQLALGRVIELRVAERLVRVIR
jgi:choline kinase